MTLFTFVQLLFLDHNDDGSCNAANDQTDTTFIDPALNSLDQEDPILIDAIRKMMIKPALVRWLRQIRTCVGSRKICRLVI